MRVIVIGAGLGGLCLAQGLRRAGIDVAVYERDAGVTARFQGFRIGLAEQGLAALRGCLPEELHPLVEATLGDLTGPARAVDPWLRPLSEHPMAGVIAADRHVLRHILLAGLDDDALRFGKELTTYHVRSDGRVEARFADGTSDTADLLVGADGINSAVRARLAPAVRPHDTGVRFVIGRTPLTDRFAGLVPGFGTRVVAQDVSMLLGLMRFRRSPREAAAELVPGLSLPGTADYLRWAMLLPPGRTPEPAPGRDGAQQTVLARTEGWHPELRAVVEAADPDNSTLLSIRVVRPGPRWPLGPVTLLGDAIHATSPSGGNGANTALRDADLLRTLLLDAHAGRRTLPDAVDAYERRMLRYGAEAVEHSLAALVPFLPPTDRTAAVVAAAGGVRHTSPQSQP
ncbi:FAD-dependent oxidoreductase [Streptomyces hesseae]|uniref:NAD(P)/FAD-dependent oxidoreductase n=1 Tax=Streptomyces hesseae TaxID=3075519 RepID=A0ABU2SFE3_9ACTN|nr:NAD(P)/FAD-dependent oxidoreductase [Streptomyces sp. DSM 40473]MDT0447687.1 NAD(P)/FAD-dependent oxidoreductase [Streptomyces sp. DSM 40473]